MDMPNERSSHVKPVPRGGGAAAAFGISALACLEFFPDPSGGYLMGLSRQTLTFGMSVFLISSIGLFDDIRSLSPKVKLLVQILAAVVAATTLVSEAEIFAGVGQLVRLSFVVLVAFLLISATNLVNFADGINGLSAASLGTGFLAARLLFNSALAPNDLALVAFAMGSLLVLFFFNAVRRAIFLGDVASTALGFSLTYIACRAVFAHLSIDIDHCSDGWPSCENPTMIHVSTFVLLTATVVSLNPHPFLDCGTMLIAKKVRGLAAFMPHRLHMYQRLSRAPHFSHEKSAAIFISLQIAWLFVLAISPFPRADASVVISIALGIGFLVALWVNVRALDTNRP